MYWPKRRLNRITHLRGIPVQRGAALTRQDSHHPSAAPFQAQYPRRPARRVPAREAAALPEEEEEAEEAAVGNNILIAHC